MKVPSIAKRILAQKKGDASHLSIVLCEKHDGQFVTWLHNHSDGGMHWGHYKPTLSEAVADYNERGEPSNLTVDQVVATHGLA